MRERLAALLLPPLLFAGFFLRQAAAPQPGTALPGLEGAAQAGPLLDPAAAGMARRVELALSAGRVPQADRFLSHPHSTPEADPPLFPALLAWTAGLVLEEQATGQEGAPPDERRLEGLLSQIGPGLWLLLALAGILAARRGSSRAAGVRAGVAALALLALTPVAVRLGGVGQLAIEQWTAILFLAQVALCRAAWSAEEGLDRMQGALLAGLVTGFGLASSPLFAAPALAAWAGFLLAAWSAAEPQARDRARDGMLFCVSALLPAQLPVMDGLWPAAPPGPVSEWVRLASVFLIAACALFVVGSLRPVAALRRSSSAWIAAGACALALVCLPVVASGIDGPSRPIRAALGLLPGSAAGGFGAHSLADGAALAELLPLALLFLYAMWVGRDARPRSESIQLVLAGGLTLIAALVHAPALLLFLVPLALSVDACCSGAWGRQRGVGKALLLVLAWGGVLLVGELRDVRAAEGREGVHALRWLRDGSDPSGPWNAAGLPQDYGVLAEGELAGLVPYHARRPVLGAGAWAAGDPRGVERVRALLGASDPDELVRGALRLGARYIIARELREGDAGDPGVGAALRELAGPDALPPAGAVRVFQHPADAPSASVARRAPTITIYRLEAVR